MPRFIFRVARRFKPKLSEKNQKIDLHCERKGFIRGKFFSFAGVCGLYTEAPESAAQQAVSEHIRSEQE
jgi:hypothetical protein